MSKLKGIAGVFHQLLRGIGLKTKIVTVTICAIVLTTIGGSSFFYIRTKAIVFDDLQKRGMTICTNLGNSARFGVLTEDIETLGELVKGVMETEDVVYVVIQDEEGKTLTEKASVDLPEISLLKEKALLARDSEISSTKDGVGNLIYSFSSPIIAKKVSIAELGGVEPELEEEPSAVLRGVVQVGLSLSNVLYRLRNVLRGIIVLTGIIIGIGVIFSLGFVRVIMKPIAEMTDVAVKITSGDLRQKVEVKSDDEIGQFASQFNVMTDALRKHTQELTAANVQLTREVGERKRAESALAEERNLLRTLIDNLPDFIYIKDMNSKFITANTSVTYLMGQTVPENILGKTDFDFYPEKAAKEFYNDEQKVIRTGEPVINKEESATDMSGRKRWFLTTKVPLRGSNGKIIGIVGMGHDITERKQVEEARDRLNRELEAKNKELESILYVASHDLRTSLVNIQGFSEELSRSCNQIYSSLGGKKLEEKLRVALNEDIPEALGFILTSASRIDSLLSGLLRLSRLGRASISIEPLDMNSMIDEVLGSMEYQIKEAGVRVEIEPLPECFGDSSQINQVFSNLIDNAIKYLDSSRPGLIKISGKVENGWSIYCIEDNGCGIEAAYQDRIFEIFDRLKPDQTGGEGLGLTIVKRILDRHNGRVWLKSEAGKGSNFFVSLRSI